MSLSLIQRNTARALQGRGMQTPNPAPLPNPRFPWKLLGGGAVAISLFVAVLAFAIGRSSVSPAVATPPPPAREDPIAVQARINQALEALYGDIQRPQDEAGQQRLIREYRKVQAQADALGVEVDARRVSQRAYQVQEFALAVEAWQDAYRAKQVGLGQVREYLDALRNTGWWWIRTDDAGIRYVGLRYLVTCARVAEQSGLAHECASDLDQEAPNPAQRPPSLASPLLAN